MSTTTKPWNYLIVTAANDQQAQAYEFQIQKRRESGDLPPVRHCLVIPDIEGKRIGSGGSTLQCLQHVLELEGDGAGTRSFEEAEAVLRGLRILIVHAGGDSRRLPAYSHCGKMFVPVPNATHPAVASTLFDRLVPPFLALPETPAGQVVVASGDALILFDASAVQLSRPGITALGGYASAEEAAHHGVFCADREGFVRLYLQKPKREAQAAAGALNEAGQSVLDLGVMSMDASAAVQFMRTFFQQRPPEHGEPALVWRPEVRDALLAHGIDLYREVCCALGTDTTDEQYLDSLRASGSRVAGAVVAEWFPRLHKIPLNLQILPDCQFLHFGTTRQLITSGLALLTEDAGRPIETTSFILNSEIHGEITAQHAWIEGCSIAAGLVLEGFNAVVGVDIIEPLKLPKGACLDLSAGLSHKGEAVWFVRCYDIDDTFKHSVAAGGTICGMTFPKWLDAMGMSASDIWPPEVPEAERTLWNARVFPAEKEHGEFRNWMWLYQVESATADQKRRFRAADRYSAAEIAVNVDPSKFHARRSAFRSGERRQASPECLQSGNPCAVECG